MAFSVKPIQNIITNEKGALLPLMYEEMEDQTELDTTLEIGMK